MSDKINEVLAIGLLWKKEEINNDKRKARDKAVQIL